jgi:hypothetical protein
VCNDTGHNDLEPESPKVDNREKAVNKKGKSPSKRKMSSEADF